MKLWSSLRNLKVSNIQNIYSVESDMFPWEGKIRVPCNKWVILLKIKINYSNVSRLIYIKGIANKYVDLKCRYHCKVFVFLLKVLFLSL